MAGRVPLWGNIPLTDKRGLKRGKKGKTYIVYNIVGFGTLQHTFFLEIGTDYRNFILGFLIKIGENETLKTHHSKRGLNLVRHTNTK